MSEFSFVHTFGPLVQMFFVLVLLSLIAIPLGHVAFWCEYKFLKTKIRWLWAIPAAASVVCTGYGALRFLGVLIYPSDGWASTGHWNYTNQNQGACIIFVCGCLLLGMILAIYKERRKIDET